MTLKIIAEMGVDHEGNIERVWPLLHAAALCRCSCFKTQYYKQGLEGPNRVLPWLSPEDMLVIDEVCSKEGISFLVTPHDKWALDFVYTELGHRTIKLGSGDWHLLETALSLPGVNLIVSTGMHNRLAFESLLSRLKDDTGHHTILHCISEYPTPTKNLQLNFIRYMKNATEELDRINIGYSDHSSYELGALAPAIAIAYGAQVVEKHLTNERNVEGKQDTFCSITPDDLPTFCQILRTAYEMQIGREDELRTVTEGERKTLEWVDRRNSL